MKAFFRRLAWLAGLCAAAFSLLVYCAVKGGNPTGPDNPTIVAIVQTAVEPYLRSPRGADFDYPAVGKTGDQQWTVAGTVHAQNLFGVKLPVPYIGSVINVCDGRYAQHCLELRALAVDGRVVYDRDAAQAIRSVVDEITGGGSAEMRKIQQSLSLMGYDPGPADGLDGPKTRAAIRAWQKEKGLPETGEVDDRVRRELAR